MLLKTSFHPIYTFNFEYGNKKTFLFFFFLLNVCFLWFQDITFHHLTTGNLLFNVVMQPDGTLAGDREASLLKVGKWL